MAPHITRWTKDDPPNLLLAIDPGASWPATKIRHPYAGCALFRWGELVWASTVRCPLHDTARFAGDGKIPPFAMPNTLVRRVCEVANVARHSGDPLGRIWQSEKKKIGGAATLGEQLTVLAVENPLIYVKGKARPQDILALGKIYGAFMGGIDAEFYSGPSPEEWKGSIDGEIMNERVLKVLNVAERILLMQSQRVGDGGLTSHTLDACGLGLFTLGRVGKAMEV